MYLSDLPRLVHVTVSKDFVCDGISDIRDTVVKLGSLFKLPDLLVDWTLARNSQETACSCTGVVALFL